MVYTGTYLLMNIFRTYIIYLLIEFLVDDCRVTQWWKRGWYAGYFIAISATYLWLNIPIVTMVVNLLGLFALLFLYRNKVGQKILIVLFVYLIMFLAECAIFLLTGNIDFPVYDKGEYVSLFCVILLFAINVIYIFLYDKQGEVLEARKKQQILTVANQFYEQQFQLMRETEREARRIRHDIKNHYAVMQSLYENNEMEKLGKYLMKLSEMTEVTGQFVKSGNIVIDSVLNYKLMQAEREGISCDVKVTVPADLELDIRDITSILANLLDNAREALVKISAHERRLLCRVRYDRGRLIIKVSNPYEGELHYNAEKAKYCTMKNDRDMHGIGLGSVKSTVATYDGLVEFYDSDHEFTVGVLMFVPKFSER